MLAKDTLFVFNNDCLEAFCRLKEALISAPILQPPDWTLPFEVMCDASDYAVGDVLGKRCDKQVYAIYYASHTLNEAQINYATTKKGYLLLFLQLINFILI